MRQLLQRCLQKSTFNTNEPRSSVNSSSKYLTDILELKVKINNDNTFSQTYPKYFRDIVSLSFSTFKIGPCNRFWHRKSEKYYILIQ